MNRDEQQGVDRDYQTSVRAALQTVLDTGGPGPEWDGLAEGAMARHRQGPSGVLVLIGTAVLILAFSGVLLLLGALGREGRVENASSPFAAPDTTPGTETAEAPHVEVDSPEGVFVITHLRAAISGRVDADTEVRIDGTPIPVVSDGTGAPLGATFRYEFWLELGDNHIAVTATNTTGATTEIVEPVVLPNARTFPALVTDVTYVAIGSQVSFDTIDVVAADTEKPIPPPTLSMLSATDPKITTPYQMSNDEVALETIRLDPNVHILTEPSDGAGVAETSLATWASSWADGTRVAPFYWITVHDGVIVQIQEPRIDSGYSATGD